MAKSKRETGKEIINQLHEGGDTKLMKGFESIAPDFSDYILEFVFGTLYARDGLDIKTKQMVTLVTLAALGNANPQLAYHIRGALNLGIPRENIVNIFIHIAGYAGFPAANNAISTAREVFAKLDETKS